MSLLSELAEIAKRLEIPARTAVYSGKPPDEYLVFTPLYDSFELHSDNKPEIDVQEVRISLFSKGNYNQTKSRLVQFNGFGTVFDIYPDSKQNHMQIPP